MSGVEPESTPEPEPDRFAKAALTEVAEGAEDDDGDDEIEIETGHVDYNTYDSLPADVERGPVFIKTLSFSETAESPYTSALFPPAPDMPMNVASPWGSAAQLPESPMPTPGTPVTSAWNAQAMKWQAGSLEMAATDLERQAMELRAAALGMRASSAANTLGASGSTGIKTTVMFRDIPNNYTRDELITLLTAEGFFNSVDFLYLPIDHKKKANVGYAFLNLITNDEALRFHSHFEGFNKWNNAGTQNASTKVARVSWGQPECMQGLDAQIERYRNSDLLHAKTPDEYRPILLCNGVRYDFPPAIKKLRAPKNSQK
jgi:hypothetical protein